MTTGGNSNSYDVGSRGDGEQRRAEGTSRRSSRDEAAGTDETVPKL